MSVRASLEGDSTNGYDEEDLKLIDQELDLRIRTIAPKHPTSGSMVTSGSKRRFSRSIRGNNLPRHRGGSLARTDNANTSHSPSAVSPAMHLEDLESSTNGYYGANKPSPCDPHEGEDSLDSDNPKTGLGCHLFLQNGDGPLNGETEIVPHFRVSRSLLEEFERLASHSSADVADENYEWKSELNSLVENDEKGYRIDEWIANGKLAVIQEEIERVSPVEKVAEVLDGPEEHVPSDANILPARGVPELDENTGGSDEKLDQACRTEMRDGTKIEGTVKTTLASKNKKGFHVNENKSTKRKNSGNQAIRRKSNESFPRAQTTTAAQSETSEDDGQTSSIMDEFMERTTRVRLKGLNKKIALLESTVEELRRQNRTLAEEKQALQGRLQVSERAGRGTSGALTQAKKRLQATERLTEAAKAEATRLRADNEALRKEVSSLRRSAPLPPRPADDVKLRHLQQKLTILATSKEKLEHQLQTCERDIREAESTSQQKLLQQRKHIQRLDTLQQKQQALILVLQKQKISLLSAKATECLEQRFLTLIKPKS